MAKHDYIFVDESGDPGYALHPATGELLSTPYYAAAALHVVDDAFRDINRHVSNFRFYTNLNKELKIQPSRRSYHPLIEPIGVCASDPNVGIYASAVYLDKERYSGRYLKPSQQMPQDPVRFRNFVLRSLLEHHFKMYPLQSNRYDLVLDRVDTNKQYVLGLEEYLAGNRNIPSPNYITHASSIYVDGLQIVHHIANGFKGAAFEG